MKKQINFNINDYVYVKLTPYGKEILDKDSEDLARYWNKPRDFFKRNIKEDEDGYSKWQLHNLMESFGKHCFNGCNLPFETTIKIEVDI